MDFFASLLRMTFMFFMFRIVITLISSISASRKMKDQMRKNGSDNMASSPNSSATDSSNRPVALNIEMVKDQLCGTFVAKDKAYIVRTGGQDHYFCSWECRERYADQAGS